MNDLENMLASLERAQANAQRKKKNANVEYNTTREIIDNTCTKSHALARAYYRLSLVEKRCMEALISKLHPQRTDNNQELELKATEYAKTFNIEKHTAYRDISTAIHSLMRRIITTDRPNGKAGKIECALMITAEYKTDIGSISCKIHPDIVPHLISLRAKFSSYPLKVAVDFKSTYTWRFYELLVSWAQPKADTDGLFIGWFKISVDELRLMLGVPESYKYDSFQKQVLNVVTKELEDKANIKLLIERIKTSRRITHLNIQFIEKKPILKNLIVQKREKST